MNTDLYPIQYCIDPNHRELARKAKLKLLGNSFTTLILSTVGLSLSQRGPEPVKIEFASHISARRSSSNEKLSPVKVREVTLCWSPPAPTVSENFIAHLPSSSPGVKQALLEPGLLRPLPWVIRKSVVLI